MHLVLGLIVGCDEGPATQAAEPNLAEYAGESGLAVTLQDMDDTGAAPVELRLGADAWEARVGASWDEGEVLGVWPVVRKPALELDGVTLLESPLPPPAELDVYYGTFPEVISSEVAKGEFAGEWSFARGLGPIVATLAGVRRECVVYVWAEQGGEQ